MTSRTPAAAPAPRPLSREQVIWRWKILFATYWAYAGYYLTRKAFTICKKSIATEFHWNSEDVSYIWVTYLVAYMVGQFLCSYLGRERGARFLLLGGLALSMAFNTVFGFANSYATFLVFMFFNGLVQASGWPGSVGGVSEWLRKEERGTIMGFWSTSYIVGNILVKSLGGLVLGWYGWRWSFWGLTLLTVGIWFIIYFWQRNRPEDVGLEPIVTGDGGDSQAIKASQAEKVTWGEYLSLALHPVILAMGTAYFCLKFMRYALDSWLTYSFEIQGLTAAQASLYSTLFDIAGIIPAVLAGYLLDRAFRGNWALVCFLMGLGLVFGYASVLVFGSTPLAAALCFGIVGFMIYGPDTLLSGAAAVQVAGERNGLAVAGLVNGLGSAGPIFQEVIIGRIMLDETTAIHNTNLLALGMSILFAILMLVVMLRLWMVKKHSP